MHSLKALAVVVSAGLALGLTALPAQADTQSKGDPRGDVVTRTGDDRGTTADRRRTDVLSLVGEHGDGRLRFTVTLADASTAPGPSAQAVVARFVTPGGADYSAVLERFGSTASTTLTRDGEQVTCEGLSGRVVAAKDRVVLTVPRSCADAPRSVRFGAAAYFLTSDSTVLGDDARRDGAVGDQPRLGTAALAND